MQRDRARVHSYFPIGQGKKKHLCKADPGSEIWLLSLTSGDDDDGGGGGVDACLFTVARGEGEYPAVPPASSVIVDPPPPLEEEVALRISVSG